MLIIADESVDGRIISALREEGYSVLSIASEYSGIADQQVIEIAIDKKAFIITEDKDFGDELVYKRISFQVGSLLLRLSDVDIATRVQLVIEVLASHSTALQMAFSVLTSKKLRIRKYLE